jgi:hypothetical protein
MPDEDFLTLYLDSSLADVIFTPPKINPKTGEIVNEDAITCRDGGYLPLNSHAPGARGFKAIYLWTPTGTCIGTLGVKNTIHDSPLARPLLASVENIIKPRIERLHPMVGVLCADGAFTSDEHRRQIRRMGCIENIARTNKFSENEVKRLDDLRIPFGQHPGWYTNGHAEINCHCGTAHLTCDWEPAPRAGVRATVVARCPKHGRLHVTSGEYVNRGGAWWTYNPKVVNKTQAPKKKPKTKSESEAAESDLRLGNGLTFNHWLAQEFGQKRWGHNEGIHGALANLGIIFNGSNRFRTIEEFEIANFQMLTYLHHRGIRRRLLTAVPLAA